MADSTTDENIALPQSSPASRLKDAAYSMARDRGLAALSARNLSRETGTSPSAVNYYFGNRELLISEITAEAVAASQAWREIAWEQRMTPIPSWATIDTIFTALIEDRLDQGRNLLALLQELEQEASSGRHPSIGPVIATEMDAESAFWTELAIRNGATPSHAEIWSCLALGLISLMLSETRSSHRTPWISAPTTRLGQRLNQMELSLSDRGGVDASTVAALAPVGDTAMKILDAALGVIAETGPEALTQREVASRAGVSLAGVTYFFRTKSDLLSAAFLELCRRHCILLTDNAQNRSEPEVEIMLAFHDGESLLGMAAMEALLRAATRMPELIPTVDIIRQNRGVATRVLLKALGLQVDPLDAYLWSSVLSGKYRTVRCFEPSLQTSTMLGWAKTTLHSMFRFSSE